MRNWLRKRLSEAGTPLALGGTAALLFALLVGAALALSPETVSVSPAVESPRFLPSVDLLVVGVVLLTAWGLTVTHRCTDARISRLLHLIVLLMVLWLILAMGKLVVGDPGLKSLLWYAQGIPLLFIPLLFLFCILRTSSLDARPGVIALERALVGIGLALSLLALTNNAHQAVFAVDLGSPGWETGFSYGLGYYPFLVLMIASMVASLMLLAITSHRKIRWRIVWIAVLFSFGTLYWALVLTRSWGMQPGNNALAGCMIFVASIEFCLDLGFFPAARHYFSLFRNLPFDLKILTDSGAVAYRTSVARSLDGTTLSRLAASMKGADGESGLTTRSDSTPGLIYKLYRLNAGLALLTENASEIDRLQAQLRERQRTLANQNELLGRAHAMQSLLYRQKRESELGERVERDLAATANQIGLILDNRVTGDGESVRTERIKQLNLVKVLVAYSKRKGMLALAAAESETMEAEELDLIAREAMADLRSIGIECAVLVAVREQVPIAAVNTVYDSFYDCIIAVLPQVNPVIMTFISRNEAGELVMRATIECAIGIDSETAVEQIPAIATSTESWTSVQMGIAHELEGRLSVRDSAYSVTLEDGLVVATVRAPAAAAD